MKDICKFYFFYYFKHIIFKNRVQKKKDYFCIKKRINIDVTKLRQLFFSKNLNLNFFCKIQFYLNDYPEFISLPIFTKCSLLCIENKLALLLIILTVLSNWLKSDLGGSFFNVGN